MLLKKVTIFILLGIFVFNTAGYFVTFKMLQYQIKKEVKRELKRQVPTSELAVIDINKNQLKDIVWEKKGKEFYYKGKLYDIVRSAETPASTTYYCIDDTQEATLFANLNEHVDRYIASNKTTKSRTTKKLINSSVKLYYTHSASLAHSFEYIQTITVTAFMNYTSAYPEISSPPPELI